MTTIENKDLKFGTDVIELLLKGGQIIAHHSHTTGLHTILIRMPKSEFIPHDDEEFGHREFEYAYAHNYLEFEDPTVLIIGGWKNGHLREVKRKVSDGHYENGYHYGREQRKKRIAELQEK